MSVRVNEGIDQETRTSKLVTLIRGAGTTGSLLNSEAEAIMTQMIVFH